MVQNISILAFSVISQRNIVTTTPTKMLKTSITCLKEQIVELEGKRHQVGPGAVILIPPRVKYHQDLVLKI